MILIFATVVWSLDLLLSVKHVSKTFATDGGRLTVLDAVSLTLYEG